jgi:hypothetical protein
MEILDQSKPVQLTNNCLGHLSETRKWTLFMAILGFIFMGLCIIIIPIILVTSGLSGANGSGLVTTLPLLLVTVLYFFPVFYLFKFSINSKNAILESDGILLEVAFKYLKLHYRFMGVLVIISIVVYSIVGVGLILTSGLR